MRPPRPTLDPRADAAMILVRVLRGAERSTDLLNSVQSAYPPERSKDARLLHELVMGVLRRRLALVACVSRHLHRPLETAAAPVREVLLTMAYQAIFLSRVPAHATVSASVDAARRLGGEAAGRFVNAIGRELLRDLAQANPVAGMPAEVLWSMPQPALACIESVLGARPGASVLAALGRRAPFTVRVNRQRASREDAARLVEALGFEAGPTEWAAGGLTLRSREGGKGEGLHRLLGDPAIVPPLLVPQDEASQLVVQVLDPRPGERVIDLCAGGGIKTSQIVAAVRDASVIAVDRDPGRLDRCLALCRTMGLDPPRPLAVDATLLPPDMDGAADAVLLDAPCTGLGTIRRRPEVRYVRTASDIARASAIQARLLGRAVSLLRPGGRLVYAVCSFVTEEGPAVVEEVLSRHHGLTIDPIGMDAPFVRPDGTLLTLPWRDGMDGFYVARIRRGSPPRPS